MKRFGYYIRLGGDKEVSEALKRGDAVAMLPAPRNNNEACRRVAMMKHTPEEWREMTLDARQKYRRNRPVTGVRGALLVGVALVVLGLSNGVEALWRAVERSGRGC